MTDARTDAPSARRDSVTDPTEWRQLPPAEPIALRDPLAELLGMVSTEDPLVVTFPEVAKAAGHACPAVGGAYRATQVALEALYPESLPVRGQIAVRIDGDRTGHGVGPMARVVEHITGASDESGFEGLAGHGGRQDLLTFGPVDGPGTGRSFAFTRTDTGETVRLSYDPSKTGGMHDLIPAITGEDGSTKEEAVAEWHRRVERILAMTPDPDGPLVLERD
ncbi:MAG: hypothetical protein R3324_10770 [Halobacteriales archaeon]|nr:hypothetical protein [Halobacteriales archaeon]